MASIQFYLDLNDLETLSEWLSSEADLALIESCGDGYWRANRKINLTASGRYKLFHIPSGPLPLMPKSSNETVEIVEDPFEGWQENRSGADSTQPYFGPGHPAVFRLVINLIDQGSSSVSHFEWIGNHYSAIGRPATDSAMRWWKRLRRWIKKNEKVGANGFTWAGAKEVHAFPSVAKLIKSGKLEGRNKR